MKRLLKDKRGMTLAEIVVALTILMIVVVGTTPVMLSAYDGLYKAGEKTQEVYDAKTEIEQSLATRNSAINYKGFIVNFNGLGQSVKVNGNRAVSSLYNSLETIFTGAKARVYIASGSVVNDDTSSHTIVLQTSNIDFKAIAEIGTNGTETLSPRDDETQAIETLVDVTAYIPQKELVSTLAADIYKNQKAVVTLHADSTNVETGRIGITISGTAENPIDFTTSPIKIVLKYLDENDKEQKVHTYLTIKTPTIMFAGETSDDITYYTTAGVVKEINKDGSYTTSFTAEARKMNIGKLNTDKTHKTGAQSTQVVPAGTVFKSINWITEYARTTGGTGNENIEFANTSYEPQYYVLTGTNGAIYRTYSFNASPDIVGKVNLNASTNDDPGINGLDLNSLTKKSQLNNEGTAGIDVMGVKDTYVVLDDRANTIVYPAVWGGDFSHVFGYSSYGEHIDYKGTSTWYTEEGDTGLGQAGYYSNLASFGYYYNGYGMEFDGTDMGKRWTRNSRKISYILTETVDALRVGGLLKDTGHYDRGVNRIWERPLDWKHDGNMEQQLCVSDDFGISIIPAHAGFDYFYYYKDANNDDVADETFPRAVLLDPGASDERFNNNKMKALPIYFANSNHNDRGDEGFAQLRLKALTTISPNYPYDRWMDPEDGGKGGSKDAYDTSILRLIGRKDINESKIIVTDAVYIPATATTEASVFYVGTVAAYAYVMQTDNIGGDAQRVRNNGDDNTGGMTTYYIMSDDEGTNTTIHKYSTRDKGTSRTDNRIVMSKSIRTDTENAITANEDAAHSFFVNRIADDATTSEIETQSALFNDVLFTMGYTSNREMVYSKIVYGINQSGSVQEAYKSYEPLYFISHHDGNEFHVPNGYFNKDCDTAQVTKTPYLNTKENDYYNVWFPGEMYNLTKVATKDNVTVAVGYAVSGSSYSWAKDGNASYVSTGLGSIYNDGVMSGMVLGDDSSFNSLLYYKDAENFDSTYLSSTSPVKDANNNYGTHARDSVQFTCVDISIVQLNDKYYYYAYYADNKGRVFRSLVAYKELDDTVATMVTYVSDDIVTAPNTLNTNSEIDTEVGKMEQIFVGTNDPFTNYFSEIKSIVCDESHIVVAGKSKGSDFNIVVGTITPIYDNPDSKDKVQIGITITWKNTKISGAAAAYTIEDMMVLGDYVYCVGTSGHHTPDVDSDDYGFILAVSTPYLDTLSHNGEILDTRTGNADGYYFWGDAGHDTNGDGVGDEDHVKMPIYAIAGKTT